MKQERSDKQKAAAILYKQIISVKTTELARPYEIRSYNGEIIERKQGAVFSVVNGKKYIMNGSLPYYTKNFIKNMQKSGVLSDSDFIHAFRESSYRGARLVVFVKVEPLLRLKNDLYEYLKSQSFVNEDEYKRVFDMMADNSPIATNVISDERIKESENAFSRRVQLISEDGQERRIEAARQKSEELKAERVNDDSQTGLVISNIVFSDKDVEELSFKIEHDEMSPDVLRLIIHHKNLEGLGDCVDDEIVLNSSQMKALGKALLFAGEYVETLYSRNK